MTWAPIVFNIKIIPIIVAGNGAVFLVDATPNGIF